MHRVGKKASSALQSLSGVRIVDIMFASSFESVCWRAPHVGTAPGVGASSSSVVGSHHHCGETRLMGRPGPRECSLVRQAAMKHRGSLVPESGWSGERGICGQGRQLEESVMWPSGVVVPGSLGDLAGFGKREGKSRCQGILAFSRMTSARLQVRGQAQRDLAVAATAVKEPAAQKATVAAVENGATSATSVSEGYGAEKIQVLQGLEPVRMRPGMYIGSTGPRGLHHLVYEVVDNAIDEAQAGFATTVEVELLPGGQVAITDNGRGIPTDVHPVTGKSALETVLTMLHAGGKFGGDSSGYSVSGGLHGVGVSVVNALSEDLRVIVWRNGREFIQEFRRGVPRADLSSTALPPSRSDLRGTRVEFRPDPTIFTTSVDFDFGTISARLRELAFLNPAVTLVFRDTREEGKKARESVFRHPGGLQEYVQWLNGDKEPLHVPLAFSRQKDGITVDVCLQWCSDSYTDTILGYANSIRTTDGGTHLDGAKAAITRTLNALGRKSKTIKEKDENLSGEHAREGLTCVVSVKIANPEFEGQTKTRLGNPEARRAVDQAVGEAVTEFLELNPATLDAILSKALSALRAAEAAKKARELVRRKSVLKSTTLPGKLSDCSCTDPSLSEIFVVEGDSAGGSAKQGRDRRFQAILPLRGKILNIERKDDSAIYKNTELQNLIIALGLGIKGEEFNKNQLRYHKIIILTDADVDGAHIRTLLLTFLFRYQRGLFENGHVYVGVPPLYKVERGKSAHYCYKEEDLKVYINKTLPANASYSIQRFKGLGEMMPQQLWDTTLDPTKRTLKQLTTEDAAEANVMFSKLMGDKVGPRKELIQSMAPKMLQMDMLDV